MRLLSRRPPAQPDLANVFVPYEQLYREQVEPPKPKRRPIYRNQPIHDPFH